MTKTLLILAYILIAYLTILLITFFFQRSLLYLPSKEKIDINYYSNTGLNEVELITSDGLVLKSLFKKPLSQDKSTIIIFHGNAGHIGHRVDKFEPFMKAGYGLLLLEYRGYGDNPGNPTEQGLYEDGQAALDFLSNQNISPKRTILYGESLGCGVATKLSTKFAYQATILEAPYTSIANVAQLHYWYLPAKWLVLDRFDIMKIIDKMKTPLLIVHGEKDNIIKIELGKKVFDAAPEPKKSLYIPNAGHNNLYDFNLYEEIFSFIEKNT